MFGRKSGVARLDYCESFWTICVFPGVMVSSKLYGYASMRSWLIFNCMVACSSLCIWSCCSPKFFSIGGALSKKSFVWWYDESKLLLTLKSPSCLRWPLGPAEWQKSLSVPNVNFFLYSISSNWGSLSLCEEKEFLCRMSSWCFSIVFIFYRRWLLCCLPSEDQLLLQSFCYLCFVYWSILVTRPSWWAYAFLAWSVSTLC